MYQKEIPEKQASAWQAAALAVPLVQAAAACSWLAAGAVGTVCLLVCWGTRKVTVAPGRWLRGIQCLWLSVLISELLHGSGQCWTDSRGKYAVPLVLLLLGLWTVSSRTNRAARAGCTLLWPTILPLGAVFLSGIPQIRWGELTPVWKMPDADLMWVLLIPVLCGRGRPGCNGKTAVGLGLLALTACAAASSVLPGDAGNEAPVYELSRSLSLFGAAERLESVTAAALTMGYYTAVSYLLETQAEEADGKKRVLIWGILSGVLFLSGIRLDSQLLALGSLALGVILPILLCWKKNPKKWKKPLDKRKRK
ncbi:hypothetical protein MR626_00600 [bacterium]|nr:hypothetical protein [bacterium]